MATNVSIWIRAFRLPLQRAYPRLEASVEAIDVDLAELLRRADERQAESDADEDDTPTRQ